MPLGSSPGLKEERRQQGCGHGETQKRCPVRRLSCMVYIRKANKGAGTYKCLHTIGHRTQSNDVSAVPLFHGDGVMTRGHSPFSLHLTGRNTEELEGRNYKTVSLSALFLFLLFLRRNSSHIPPFLILFLNLPLSCLQGGRWQTGLARSKAVILDCHLLSIWVPALSCCPSSWRRTHIASPLGRGIFLSFISIICPPRWWDDFLGLMCHSSMHSFSLKKKA